MITMKTIIFKYILEWRDKFEKDIASDYFCFIIYCDGLQ